MEPIYSLETDSQGGAVRVRLAGEIDVSVADEVHAALTQVVADVQPGAHAVALDLSELQFIDSSGIRALLQTVLDARTAELEVSVVAVSDPVRRVLDIAGVSAMLGVAPEPGA
jgi:anti-anti-sigma factor